MDWESPKILGEDFGRFLFQLAGVKFCQNLFLKKSKKQPNANVIPLDIAQR